jgi:hypothetical protein
MNGHRGRRSRALNAQPQPPQSADRPRHRGDGLAPAPVGCTLLGEGMGPLDFPLLVTLVRHHDLLLLITAYLAARPDRSACPKGIVKPVR